MYKYTVDDETTNKVVALANNSSNNDKINKLIEELNNYNKLYDYSSDIEYEPVEYKRMEDVVLDEDAIKKQAENELAEYKNSSIKGITDTTASEVKKLNEDKESSKENYESAKNSVKDYYSDVRENASNDALKRGLSRSSIVINVMDAFNQAELSKYNELNDTLTKTINDIDAEISSLNAKQEQALQDFDITYAVKLQDKINSLTSSVLDKQEEVLKYNNEIAEKEAEYNRKYAELEKELNNANWEKEQDLMEYAGKYGVNMISKYKETQNYNIAEKYLDSIDKTTAISELTNNATLRDLLGASNVAKLLEKYS